MFICPPDWPSYEKLRQFKTIASSKSNSRYERRYLILQLKLVREALNGDDEMVPMYRYWIPKESKEPFCVAEVKIGKRWDAIWYQHPDDIRAAKKPSDSSPATRQLAR